jgi:hypothetical protein
MALKKGKSSSAQPRKKTSRLLNINGTEKTPADQLMTRVVNTFFDLNYDLHHATILDNDDSAVSEASDQINKSIDAFAFMITNIPSKLPVTYQEAVDKMKFLNEGIFQQTKINVKQNRRNHFTGRKTKSSRAQTTKNTIKFIVTVKNDFSKCFIREISSGNLLGACRI